MSAELPEGQTCHSELVAVHPAQKLLALGHPRAVQSTLLYTLFTFDCVASQRNNSFIKFADDSTVIGLIIGGNETAYLKEMVELVDWCDHNNLSLNTDKTKDLIVDSWGKRQDQHTPLLIGEREVDWVKTFEFLDVHIIGDLTSSHNINHIVWKSQHRLYNLSEKAEEIWHVSQNSQQFLQQFL